MSSSIAVGTITVLMSLFCFGCAFLFSRREHYALAITFIVIGGFVLRFSSSLYFFLNTWDERYHALVAKNLLEHPLVPTLYDDPAVGYDYRSWAGNHIWVHKPPMSLWIIMGSLKIFGINEMAIRIPSIILSSLCILLTFFIARKFFSPKTAIWASFFHAINGLLVELASARVPTDHIDTIFCFFVELAVLIALYAAKNPSFMKDLLLGITIGFAILTKSLPALVVLPMYFLLLLQAFDWKAGLKRCTTVFIVACATFIPWQWYISVAFPIETAWETQFNTLSHLLEPLEGHGGTGWYQVAMMPRIFGELIYIPLGLYIYSVWKEKDVSRGAVLLTWIALPYIFFSFVATKMPGYIMFCAPAVFIILAEMIQRFFALRKTVQYKFFVWIIILLLVMLPIRYSMERIRPFRNIDRNPGWVRELRLLQNKIGTGKAAVFNIEHPIEAMFYAKVSAYAGLPNAEQINEAHKRGFRIYIYDDPKLPESLRNDSSLVILKSSVESSAGNNK